MRRLQRAYAHACCLEAAQAAFVAAWWVALSRGFSRQG